MSVALQRAAYSTNIKTRRDHSCAVVDPAGRIVAQSFSQPAHLGTLAHFVPRILAAYGQERLRPGDGLVCNDGHLGGIHLNDVATVMPVFHDGRIIAYVATMAHHLDVGGGTPGSIGLHEEHVQEGLIIPPSLLVRDGAIDESLLGLILRNVRAPRETGGDFRAQLASSATGIRRVLELAESETPAGLAIAIEGILDYTERRVRASLARLPHGTVSAEGFLDGDGRTDEPIRVAVSVTLDDDGATFDLTGTDPQRPSSINTTAAMTFAGCAYAFRVFLDPDIPVNDGFYRMVKLIAPPGTVVNAVRPAAIGAGADTGIRVTRDRAPGDRAASCPRRRWRTRRARSATSRWPASTRGPGATSCSTRRSPAAMAAGRGRTAWTRSRPTSRTPRTRRSRRPRRPTRCASSATGWCPTPRAPAGSVADSACAGTTSAKAT